jgi:hypothetical protein
VTVYYEFKKLEADQSPVITQLTPASTRGCTTFFKSNTIPDTRLPLKLQSLYTQYATTASMHGKPMLVSMGCLPMNWSGQVQEIYDPDPDHDAVIKNNWLIPFPAKTSQSKYTINAKRRKSISHRQKPDTTNEYTPLTGKPPG